MFVGMRSLKARCQFFGSSFQVPDLWHEHVSNEAQAMAMKYAKRMMPLTDQFTDTARGSVDWKRRTGDAAAIR
jgi:hypothetical protein